MTTPPRGPFCQSCGMPLSRPEDFGTGAEGFRVNDYCHFCYQNGGFTDPDITCGQMIKRCAALIVRQGAMSEPAARHLMAAVIPKLKRWHRADARAQQASSAA